MTRAIEFIEREYQRQPKLAEIARFVGLSEFHFNRLFRRWTGLTPKQYLAEVTSRAAGTALRSEPSVLDAAHSVGLSGGGRLHDLTVTLEAMTPGEIRAGGAGVTIRHGDRGYAIRNGVLRRDAARLMSPGIHRRTGRRKRAEAPARSVAEGEVRARRRARYDFGRDHLGSQIRNVAARRVRHQFPGAGLACLARTRCRARRSHTAR